MCLPDPVRESLFVPTTWHLKNGIFHRQFVTTPTRTITGRFWRTANRNSPRALLSAGSLLSIRSPSAGIRNARNHSFRRSEWLNERIALLQVEVDRIATLRLPVHWETAEDPFFLPTAKGKALMQRLMETKKELVWDGPEPLPSPASTGTAFFGERFAIRQPDMTPVHCLRCLRIRSVGGSAKIR